MPSIELVNQIDDPNGIVSKLVFESDDAIAETVLYRYGDRVVVCFSTQSGCPVGCTFCGTGNRFVRTLKVLEIITQIETSLNITGRHYEKIQLMSMSMGEPMLMWNNTMELVAKEYLDEGVFFFVSTVGIKNYEAQGSFLRLAENPRFGLQFSLHRIGDERRKLFRNADLKFMTIPEILYLAENFREISGNPAYFNWIVRGDETQEEFEWLATNLKGHHLTCSVMCNTKHAAKSDSEAATKMANKLLEMSNGFLDVSVFNPAGQDTIGGGCGQLLYVQEALNKK